MNKLYRIMWMNTATLETVTVVVERDDVVEALRLARPEAVAGLVLVQEADAPVPIVDGARPRIVPAPGGAPSSARPVVPTPAGLS